MKLLQAGKAGKGGRQATQGIVVDAEFLETGEIPNRLRQPSELVIAEVQITELVHIGEERLAQHSQPVVVQVQIVRQVVKLAKRLREIGQLIVSQVERVEFAQVADCLRDRGQLILAGVQNGQ